jgi:hypothetical protein
MQMGQVVFPNPFKTPLADTATLRALFGVTAGTIFEWVEEGRLIHVFDVALRKCETENWRFWTEEICNPAACRQMECNLALKRIIGLERRSEFRTMEVSNLLLISQPSVFYLCKTRELDSRVWRHTRWITRGSLAEFLARRWSGNLDTAKRPSCRPPAPKGTGPRTLLPRGAAGLRGVSPLPGSFGGVPAEKSILGQSHSPADTP